MIIKEFENGVKFAVIIDGTRISTYIVKNVDDEIYQDAGLIIELHKSTSSATTFSVTKNIYGCHDKNIPIFLLDDYLNHYSNKFQHKSPILDNFDLYPSDGLLVNKPSLADILAL